MTKLLSLIAAASAIVLSANVQAFDAEAKFNTACVACHAPQTAAALGAPAAHDAAAWKPRLEKGIDTLVNHVTNGFNAMPPRGLCMDCTAEQYKALITFMSTPK
ncbi:c-type cytochrome [Oceanobacter mangrovi]|uniref:c-type cytochrome n=1 Tax=Oceanobacter mangrovi TaxID=2862510 RepID=UPI001C8E5A85|nr:c-type cytochrome [Oceanobacter mangrovi]